MEWAEEDARRARIIRVVEEGGSDTRLHRCITLTREQVRYILALLEMRSARHYGPEAVAGAMQRVALMESCLRPDLDHEAPESGLAHLLDFLGEVCAESDGHGLWELAE